MTRPNTEPSAEALKIAADLVFGDWRQGLRIELLREQVALALDRFRAEGVEVERPADKITEGLRGAIHTTKLAGEIIDLLPPGVATRELFHRIIAILAPHIPGESR